MIEEEIKKGILAWINFGKDAKILCVDEAGSISSDAMPQGLDFEVQTLRQSANKYYTADNQEYFDYIIVLGALERCLDPVTVLTRWYSMLKKGGKLLIGADNRFAVKSFCGDSDRFSSKNFDGIEDYFGYSERDIKNFGGRCYGINELKDLLNEAGIVSHKFYSVIPHYSCAQLIYSESVLPNEELANRYYPKYREPEKVFLREEYLYTGLIKNGLFHQMANSYFIEAAKDCDFMNVDSVTLSMDRGNADSMATIILSNDSVVKKAIYSEGESRLDALVCNHQALATANIPIVDIEKEDNRVVSMPFLEGDVAQTHLRKLLAENENLFIEEMDKFKDYILSSSEIIGEDEHGKILRKGYLDLVLLNCIWNKECGYTFYDQEFSKDNYYANVLIFRNICIVFDCIPAKERKVAPEFFLERYGLKDDIDFLIAETEKFTHELRNQDELKAYTDKCGRNIRAVITNREAVNVDAVDRELLAKDCFNDIKDKDIVVFGAGKVADKFLEFYRNDFDIKFVVDNNKELQGMSIYGYDIVSPDKIHDLPYQSFKVIICANDYKSIYRQLQEKGITNVGLFDSMMAYTGLHRNPFTCEGKVSDKPYRVGYCAGVYDLYHVGHLNIFKRAKELCDYLIVGVVTDEGVRKWKKVEPYVPFEERIRMVQSCEYVDEAVRIPLMYGSTQDAFRKYNFDVQFSGSDYENDPAWLEVRDWLRAHGSEMVFFPYTQSTSSTKLKEAISK